MNTLRQTDRYIIFLFAIVLFTHAFILTKLIFFPYPELFIYPYLTNNGLTPYSQIFDQHFPGLMFLPINLNNLGMISPEAARFWQIITVLLTQILIFTITWKIFSDSKKALLASFLYLIWQPFFEGWVLWIDTFLPLMLIPGFYFFYQYLENEKFKARNFFLSGLFLGLALIFKQVVIPLVGLVLLVSVFYHKSIRFLIAFAAGFLPFPLLTGIYFFGLGVIKDFWYWTIIYNLTVFSDQGRKAPFITGLIRVVGVYSPVVLFPLLKNRKLEVSLLIFTIGSLAAIYARFDFIHLQPSLPFIVILTSVVIFKLWNIKLGRFLVVIYFAVAIIWLSVFYRGHIGEGVIYFDEETLKVAQVISENTSSKEEVFLLGPVLHLYQLSDTLPTGKIFVFQFPWFLYVTERMFLEALEENSPRIIVRDLTIEVEGRHIKDYASKLNEFIDQNYQVFQKIGNNEIMKRKDII